MKVSSIDPQDSTMDINDHLYPRVFSICTTENLEGQLYLNQFNARATQRLLHSNWIAFVCFLYLNHSLLFEHHLEFIPREIPLRLLYNLKFLSMSTICQVLQPIHPNKRGSTKYELKFLRRFYPFVIQRPRSVIYQLYNFIL